MAQTSELDVAYVAKLARLNLTGAETQLFQKQLGEVLKYAEKLREVDVSHVEAAAPMLCRSSMCSGKMSRAIG